MSKAFLDNHDTDSEEQKARRRNFISRMEKKLEFKKSVQNSNYNDDRYLLR